MKNNLKKILCLAFVMMLTIMPVSNAQAKTEPNNVRIPESFAYNGVLPNGQSIFDDNSVIISPQMILAKEFVGNVSTSFSGFNYTYKYIYGTTVSFVPGSSPTYTLTTTQQATTGTSCSISSELSADAEAIKAKLGSTITVSATATT